LKLILRIWEYFREYRFQLFLSFLFSLVVAASNGATAYYIRPVIDRIFVEKKRNELYYLVVVVVLLYLIKGIARFYQNYLMRVSSQKAIKKIRDRLFDKIISLPLYFLMRALQVCLCRELPMM